MNEKCFGRRDGNECAILEEGICHGNYKFCSFYKPKWRVEHDRRLALRRIAQLPPEIREKISKKFFQGRRPWEREGV